MNWSHGQLIHRCVNRHSSPWLPLTLLQGGWEEAVRFFDSLCRAHGVVRANAVTFGIMMNAYLARDEPHKVWGKCEGGPGGEGCQRGGAGAMNSYLARGRTRYPKGGQGR